MGSFKMMTRSELKTRRKLPPEDLALFDQFKSYLTRIGDSDVVVYELGEGEDRQRCRKILRKAARALDARIRKAEQVDSLVFYRKRARRARSEGSSPKTPRMASVDRS
jgi:hypothetical protein